MGNNVRGSLSSISLIIHNNLIPAAFCFNRGIAQLSFTGRSSNRMNTHNDVRELDRTPFSLYESVINPITTYLKDQGVDFRFHTMVTDLKTYAEW